MEPVSPQLYYLMYFNYFYPQAPHGACQSYFSSALKIYLISILRLRMEPVKMQAFLKNLCEYFYPQAPHGACRNDGGYQAGQQLISILRLRMEPVEVQAVALVLLVQISILRLRMEPVPKAAEEYPPEVNFYPQAPHGACLISYFWNIMIYTFLSSGSAWSLSSSNICLWFPICISILRLRMEPVNSWKKSSFIFCISILRLRMEPVLLLQQHHRPLQKFLSSGSAWSLSAKNTKNMSYSHSVFLQHYQ